MNDSVLKTLIKILVYLSYIHDRNTTKNWVDAVYSYLQKFNLDQTKEEITSIYNLAGQELKRQQNVNQKSLYQATENQLCQDIEKTMLNHEKVMLFILLNEFIHSHVKDDQDVLNSLNTLTATCSVPGSNTTQLKDFILSKQSDKLKKASDLIISGEIKEDETQELEGAWVEENRPKDLAKVNILEVDELDGDMYLLYERNINAILFKYIGNQSLTHNKQTIKKNQIYIFRNKDKILLNKHLLFSYKEISEYFIQTTQERKIVFSARNISLKSKSNKKILQPFSFSERSGSIVGILGGENSGKEAVVDLLTGFKKPSVGNISINGFDIFKNKHKLLGLVTEIPKEPVLIEGLTIFENYYYFAQLYFRYLDRRKITDKIFTVLNKLGLQNLKSLKWQPEELNELSKLQVKLLNLGIGLLKDPAVLILEEPFDNLSTLDIQELFSHYRELAMKGKLLFVSSTPPYLFNLREYDKLWIFDHGGYPIYNGKPENVISYFQSLSEKSLAYQVNSSPTEIWQIIQANITDKHGEKTRERKTKPAQWYDHYKKNIENQIRYFDYKNILPYNTVRIPDIDKQFIIHLVKDFFLFTRKFSDKSASFFITVFIGLLLGFLFRHSTAPDYSFSKNHGLIDFFTVTTITVFVFGIYKGKKVLRYDKPSFYSIHGLELNSAAFFTPKIFFEGGWLVCQVIFLTIIPYFIINNLSLFPTHVLIYILISSTGFFSGIILAAISKKHVTYSIILGVILFQFFFGTQIFIRNQEGNVGQKINPVNEIASLSFMRWSQEALCVDQLLNNKYSKVFFSFEKQLIRSEMYNNTLMPLIINHLDSATHALNADAGDINASEHFEIISNELSEVTQRFDVFPFEYLDSLNANSFNDEIASECRDYLTYLQFHLYELGLTQENRITEIKDSLSLIHGPEYIARLKNSSFNQPLYNLINQPQLSENLVLSGRNYHFINYPLYRISLNEFGRAHTFAATKLFNNQYISTYWFNVVMLVFGILILYSLIMAELPYYLSKRFK